MEEGESDSNDTDSTVLLEDFEQYPDKISAKRRKLAEKFNTVAVTSENVAPDYKDYFNPLLRQNNQIEDQWVMHKLSSMRNSQNAKDVNSEDLKIKRELLKQETDGTDDVVDQDSKDHNESGSNVLDCVIVIEDSDDDSVVDATNDDDIVTINSQSNDAPELDIPQGEKTAEVTNDDDIVTINSHSNDASQLNMPQVDETTIGTNDDIGITSSRYNDAQELHLPQVDDTTNATDEDNIQTINSQCNDNTSSKYTNTPECNESSKTDTTTDSLAVDKADIKGISNPEHTLPLSEGNNENNHSQRNRHKHKSKRNRKEKKKFINSSENSSAIANSSESIRNNDRVSKADVNHEDISKSHSEYSNPTENVVNVYVNDNEISRKRLVVDITSECNTKRIRSNIYQSNDSENMKNTVTNCSTSCTVISETKNVLADSDEQTIDEQNGNENKSVLETNNQSVMNIKDTGDNEEVFNEEIDRVIKYQVGFCTVLKANLAEYCQNKNRDSEKENACLKSIESLTNEIENLKALAYDGRVKVDIRFACPMCTRVSTYSTNNSVEKTNGDRCAFCSKINTLYNLHLENFLRNGKGNNNEYEVGSNNQLNISSKTCDDANNIEKPPDKDSTKLSKESNETFGCTPEVNTLGPDRIGHNNSSILGDFIPSEVIEESDKVNKLQSNNNLSHENDSATVEINTSVDIATVDIGKENHVLYKSIDVLNAVDKISSDKSTFKKPSNNDNFQKNKKIIKLNQKLDENNSDVRKVIYFNCYVCAINFDINKDYNHVCTVMKEKNVLRNCYACGVNFINNIEHFCSGNRPTWTDNIEISNVVTIKDAYIFSCVECKYSTDVYDDFVRHCQNHYIEVVDTVKCCGTCQLNFDEHRYDTHHNLHARFEVIHFSYTSLFSNWDAIFDDIPKDVTTELQTKSIYTTHSIRMAVAEDGPPEYSVYQCYQCKSCVPKLEIEKHCFSKCSDINYVCSVCDRAFISSELRVNHEVMHRNGAKIFRVIEFNRKEDRKDNLKLIQSRKLQKTDIKSRAPTAELFKCKCDLWYVTIDKFQKHIFECNSTCNGILCPKCHVTRIFLADELEKHLQLHHSEVVYEFVINEINIRRSLEPNEVKCETDAEHKKPTSAELDDAEVKLKREISKQEGDTIVISDDED